MKIRCLVVIVLSLSCGTLTGCTVTEQTEMAVTTCPQPTPEVSVVPWVPDDIEGETVGH